MAGQSEDDREPYTFSISLALNGVKEVSSFSEFLVSVYQAFLIRAEKILKQFTSTLLPASEVSNVLKLSSSFLILQSFLTVVPDLQKNCAADEVARSGEGFLKNLFVAGSKLLKCDCDTALISAILEQYVVLSQWLQYSKDLIHELGQPEVLTELLCVLEKLTTTTNHRKDDVRATVSLLNIAKACLQSGVNSSIKLQFSQSVKPFLVSPNVKLRVASKIILHPYYKNMPVLQKDELEIILQKLSAGACILDDDDVPATDLLGFLIARAHHADDCRVMLEGNTPDVLSDVIETGTEVEQNLAAELVSEMFSETSSTSINSIPIPDDISQVSDNTVKDFHTCAEGSDSTFDVGLGSYTSDICDEGSIEAVNILLHEGAKLMDSFISNPSHPDVLYMVASCVSLIWGLTKHSEVQTRVRISEDIAKSPEIVKFCCQMLEYYPDMPPIPKAAISGILHQCLMHWTSFSQHLCKKLAENGMILYLTGELEFLQSAMEMNEYVVMCLEMSLHILLNCVFAKSILPAFDFADSTTFLTPLTSCTNPSIRVKAKSILSFLHCYMDEEDMKVLQLDSEELTFILQKLVAIDTTDLDYWLRILTNISRVKENQRQLSTNEVFQLVSACGAQKLILQLLWQLSRSDVAMGMIKDQYPVIMKMLEDLQSHANSDLQSLAFCILWQIEKSDPLDLPACLRYAENCYQHGRYEECISWCDHVRQHASIDTALNNAKLLKGKSLYRSCEGRLQRFLKLKSTVNHESEPPMLINDCLAKVKESILLLGTAHDYDFLDEDGSKILDWAMIDFIREANELNSCKRCLLCRKKTLLKRSHIYPRSVLKVIAEAYVNEGEHRVYLHDLRGRLSAKSAGEITYWMLCGTCEERLSQNGENEFCKEFFSPIFQASQQLPEKRDLTLAQAAITPDSINYGQWLYNFCVGILFRGLAVSMMPHSRNKEEIYSVFLNYRKHILSLPVKIKKAKEKGAPELKKGSMNTLDTPVVVLINPTSASLHESKPFLPATLLTSSCAALASLKLDDGQPTFTLDAPFFLIRLGLVNILVEFNGASGAILNEKYSVQPESGTYPIPSEDERWSNIPCGLQELLQKDADDNQSKNIEYFLMLASDQHILKYTLEDPHDVAGLGSIAADVNVQQASMIEESQIDLSLPANASQEQLLNSATQVNLLPTGFSFSSQMGCFTYSSVNLPKCHRVLLHATDPDASVTVFLAAGASAKFSPDSPYLIILLFQGDTTIIDGVTLTREGDVAGFVSDFKRRSGTAHPARLQVMPKIQAAVEILLPNMLAENGFQNLEAVVHWTQCHWSLEEFPTLDSKCTRNGCWYCSSLCNICMQPCKIGLSKQAPGDFWLLKFCSERCQEVGSEKSTLPISVALPAHDSDNLQLPKHTLTLQFHAEKLLDTHLASNTLVKVSLLTDNFMKLFVLQQLRSVDSQVILGFSISEELSVLELLACYMGNENVDESFEKMKQEGYTSLIVQDALVSLGFQNLQLFIEHHAAHNTVEQLPSELY